MTNAADLTSALLRATGFALDFAVGLAFVGTAAVFAFGSGAVVAAVALSAQKPIKIAAIVVRSRSTIRTEVPKKFALQCSKAHARLEHCELASISLGVRSGRPCRSGHDVDATRRAALKKISKALGSRTS